MEYDVPDGIEPKTWYEVKSYFTDKKWRKIGPYSQKSNCDLLEKYKHFSSLGFPNVQKPFYMCEKKIPIPDSDSEDDDEDEVGKDKDSQVKKRGRTKSSTFIRPQEAQNISNKTDETVGLTVNARFDVCEDKTSQLKKRRTRSSTLVNSQKISNSIKKSSEAEVPVSAGFKGPGDRPQKLVIPKHLKNIKEPLYVTDLDNYSSYDENVDEFQGFTEQEFESSVINFNFVQHVKSNVENEILNGNVSKGDDMIQDSLVKENEILNGNSAKSSDKIQDIVIEVKEQAEVKSTEDTKKSVKNFTIDKIKSKFPKRNIPKVNYTEERVPDDDEYIYCDECEVEWEGPDCPKHGSLKPIPDSIVDPKISKTQQNAEASVPKNLKVAQSSLPDKYAGQGVWSLTTIPGRSVFGPFKGKKVDKNSKSEYCWPITKNRRPLYCIDALNPRYGNWMRFVNCARHGDEQNVVAYQYKRQIYYRTFKDIPPHNELLVFYGDHYAKQLGVSLEDFKKERTEPLKSRGFQCVHCKTSFSSPIYRDRHVSLYCKKNKHSEDTNRRYKCDECGKRFTWKIDLERHKLIHSGVKPHECNKCGKRFTQKGSLNKHISAVHNNEKYVCDVCNKCFTRLENLTRHKRIHNKEKPYHCDTCNKKFTTSYELTKHIRVHTGERPYKCNVCNKRFTQKGDLITHIRIHTSESPYICNVCNKRFTQKGTLKRHMTVHTGDKRYSCMYCDKKFTQSTNRNAHLKKKHKSVK